MSSSLHQACTDMYHETVPPKPRGARLACQAGKRHIMCSSLLLACTGMIHEAVPPQSVFKTQPVGERILQSYLGIRHGLKTLNSYRLPRCSGYRGLFNGQKHHGRNMKSYRLSRCIGDGEFRGYRGLTVFVAIAHGERFRLSRFDCVCSRCTRSEVQVVVVQVTAHTSENNSSSEAPAC